MRIIEIETFGRGGLTHYAYNLSLALGERGHDVTFVTTADYELEQTVPIPANVQIRKPIGRITRRIRAALVGPALRLALRAEAIWDAVAVAVLARQIRPDVIHLHCTNAAAVVYLAALRLIGRPVVYTAHVVTPHEAFRFQGVIYRKIYQWSDLIVAHSQVDRARLIDEFRLDETRVTVIPHGEYGFFDQAGQPPDRVSARQSLGLEPYSEVALFFGYIREYKGLDVLLDSWPAVVRARPKARLVIAGDPVNLESARRDELEAWARRLGAVSRFEYIPFTDVARYFSVADVLVMPYRSISQSGVLFLGLSLGVPIVATTVGALPEMLRDGESAILIPPESPTALSDALIHLLCDTEHRRSLVAAGRQVAAAHSWPSIAERTDHTFAELAGYLETS